MAVLIIEDDEGLAELIKRIVQKYDLKTVNAYSGTEALQWLSEHTPRFVILDYGLPDMNGKEFVMELINSGRALPRIVVSTGQGDDDLIEEIMALGAQDCVFKDSHFLEQLPQLIQRICQET